GSLEQFNKGGDLVGAERLGGNALFRALRQVLAIGFKHWAIPLKEWGKNGRRIFYGKRGRITSVGQPRPRSSNRWHGGCVPGKHGAALAPSLPQLREPSVKRRRTA